LEDVVKPGFVPTPEKSALFMEKNLFFYNVLLKKLIMSHAKVHVHMYKEISDGQKVFATLVIDFTQGIEGNLKVDVFKVSLNIFKLFNNWSSGCSAFIT
jgi:hypothetical protein